MPIRELSRRTGISPDLLRKWERRYGLTDPERTRGGHRLYSRVDETRIRLMLEAVNRGMRPAQAAQHALGARLTVTSRPPAPGTAQRAALRRRAIVQALTDYDEGRADSALEPLEAELSPVELVQVVLWPLVAETAPADDPIRPLILGWVVRRLGRLCDGWDRGAGPRALLAADRTGTTVPWMLGFGIALHGFGWRVTALGEGLAPAALRRAVAVARPRAVVVCVGDVTGGRRVLDELALGPGIGRVAAPDRTPAPGGPGQAESTGGGTGGGRWAADPVAAARLLSV
jgi:DNA-binding transcriptional MerR regulator